MPPPSGNSQPLDTGVGASVPRPAIDATLRDVIGVRVGDRAQREQRSGELLHPAGAEVRGPLGLDRRLTGAATAMTSRPLLVMRMSRARAS